MRDIRKFIPNPSMDYLNTDDMEEADSKIDQLLQDTMNKLENESSIKNENYGNGVIVIDEGGDETNAKCNTWDESGKSGKSDDDHS